MRSRDSILEATRDVIGESGFDGVSIAGITNPIFDPEAAERAHEYSVALLSPPAARTDDQLREFVGAWIAPVVESL